MKLLLITTPSEVQKSKKLPLEPTPQRSGGWLRRILRRVRLHFKDDHETLIVENTTQLPWQVYHDYHLLGMLDANEERTFRLIKRGTLNVRPVEGESVEYLLLPLNTTIYAVQIYQHRLDEKTEIYDMKRIA
ncbi:hypothetical protein [Ktedonospora formicarum]|uniref:Uncharacterized protein n=1 Tax=Ktedonospora formicarum TaxID=2778364 RepID=A0A8J3I8P4_9CHLR|nr:hypothetical protein [Ktedonospora formicarum]GHO50691.1 hypothetical protein KSX_88540 [Ktedonospora formicarum]